MNIPKVDPDKKPEHVGEGLLQGFSKLSGHLGEGAKSLWQKPLEGHAKDGALGAVKGAGEGLFEFTAGTAKGAFGLVGSTIEGIRHTPDAVADKVNPDRKHNKHGVEGDGKGDLLETYIEEAEKDPAHVGTGLVSGFQGLGRAVTSGAKDLVTKPMEGAKEQGAIGFLKGAGQGVLGFGAKTFTGTLDLASSVASGAQNTPDAIGRAVNDFRSKDRSSDSAPSSSSTDDPGHAVQEGVPDNQEPQHIGEGLVLGAQGFGRAFSSGFKDLTTKPMEGAREAGAVGFAKGAGEGLLSLGSSSFLGAKDLASNVVSGAKKTVSDVKGKFAGSGYPAGMPETVMQEVGEDSEISRLREQILNAAPAPLISKQEDSVPYSQIIDNLYLGSAADTHDIGFDLVVCATNGARELHESLKQEDGCSCQ